MVNYLCIEDQEANKFDWLHSGKTMSFECAKFTKLNLGSDKSNVKESVGVHIMYVLGNSLLVEKR